MGLPIKQIKLILIIIKYERKKFAIIGDPISHSLSPTMHNYWFKKYKINAQYELLHTKEKEIINVIDNIKKELVLM